VVNEPVTASAPACRSMRCHLQQTGNAADPLEKKEEPAPARLASERLRN
jgi:hypothetical protein